MAAGGEPLAGHSNDAALHAGEAGGDLHVVGDSLVQAAALLGLVLPGNTEQVQGIDIPQAHVLQLGLDLLRDRLRVLHLGNGRDDDIVLLGLLDIMLEAFLVDAEIDLTHAAFPPVLCQYKNIMYIWICRNI